MARLGRRKKFETTDGFPTIPVQKSIETMARFGRGKNFKTTVGFPTIPVQKSVETMARFGRRKKFETTDGFPTIPVVNPESIKYHLIVRGLFSNFKAPIINKLLASHVNYGSFKIRK